MIRVRLSRMIRVRVSRVIRVVTVSRVIEVVRVSKAIRVVRIRIFTARAKEAHWCGCAPRSASIRLLGFIRVY
jgi:hypothetical protein